MAEPSARNHPENYFSPNANGSHSTTPNPNPILTLNNKHSKTNINQFNQQPSTPQDEFETTNQHISNISNPNVTHPTTNTQSATQSRKSQKTKSNTPKKFAEKLLTIASPTLIQINAVSKSMKRTLSIRVAYPNPSYSIFESIQLSSQLNQLRVDSKKR